MCFACVVLFRCLFFFSLIEQILGNLTGGAGGGHVVFGGMPGQM